MRKAFIAFCEKKKNFVQSSKKSNVKNFKQIFELLISILFVYMALTINIFNI